MNWKTQFKQEFGKHFSKSELQFAIAFIEDLLTQQRESFKKGIEVNKEWSMIRTEDLRKLLK